MKAGRTLGIAVGVLLAGFVAVLLGVWALVDPNAYKPQLIAMVERSTGRKLDLPGKMTLSVFPWIALQLGPASLGNPPGFPQRPFVSFTHASVRVKLLPLLAKRLEIGHVDVDGLDVKLLENAAGEGNWQGFGASGNAPSGSAGHTASGTALPEIEGITIADATVSYGTWVVTRFNLETGSFAGHGLLPVTLHLEANRGVAGEAAVVDAHLNVDADPVAGRYAVEALNFNTVVNLTGNPRPIRFNVAAPSVAVDVPADTLTIPSFELNLAGAEVTGALAASHITGAAEARGSVKLAPVVLHEYLPRLGVALPKTRDPKALAQLTVAGDFSYGKGAMRIENIAATLDATQLRGSLGVLLATRAISFDLAVDSLDLDRYLPPPTPSGAPEHVPAPATAAQAAASQPLDARGTLTVGSVHVAPLDLTQVKVTVSTQDKVLHLFPLEAQVFGGHYSGDITLDTRAAVPALSLDEHLVGVDVGKLVASESKTLRMTGRGTVDIKGSAQGDGADSILKTLNGRFDANVADGAVEGLDLSYELGRAAALLKRQAADGSNSRQTKFDAFKLSADIVNGVATTHDLLISSAVLKLTGQGSVNLAARSLDVGLLADTQGAGLALKIPLKVTGSFASPTVLPDLGGLAKTQIKQRLENTVRDKLKGLFDR